MSENPTIERISELDFLETIYEFEDELAQNRLDHITFSSIAAMQTDETLNPGDTAIINGAIYDTLEVTEVENETDMTDPDVIYLYDGTYYKGNSGEEASGFASENGFVVVSDKNTFVTPEMFGAVGDGVTDDTQALQDAFDTGKPVVGINTYKTTAPVTLTGNNRAIDFSASKIVYTGTGSALEIKALRDSTVKLGFVEALNGNGVHFSGQVRADYSQYVDLYFHSIKADNACILADPDNTWCNEIRIHEGKMEAGDYGAYLNSKRTTSDTMVTGWIFFEVGFEGVTDGVHIESTTDWSQGYSFIDCRYAETQNKLLVTNGKVERVLLIGSNTLRYDWLDLSATTAYALFITPFRSADNIIYPAMYYDRGVTEYPLSYTSTPIDAGTDLNTIVKTGEYYASSSVTNAPIRCSPYGGLSVIKRRSMLYQTWYGSISGSSRFIMAERTSSNDGTTWSDWQYITTQSSADQITTDCDTIIRPGTYRISGATNRPANCNDEGTLVVSAAGTNVLQEYTANVATGTQSWKAFRSSNNSGTSWNNWKYITASE